MLPLGFSLLCVAVMLGACLLAGRLYRASLLHGAAGLAGLVAIGLALSRGSLRGPFAWDALVLLAAAGAGGVVLYALARRRLPRPGLLVMLHATAGGLATLLLAGFVFGR